VAGALADDEGLHAGLFLGPYELLARAGSGGMAHVWAARHRPTRAVFALKILRSRLSENASFRQMFFDEARIASRIQHENVCRTYELVELDGMLAIVMEWVDGASLIRVLRPGAEDDDDVPRIALPVRHAVKILAETCAGLHAAHELRSEDGRPLEVVHRDVSPHNVLLTLDGRVKVTDFGVAKALGKLHMTIAGQVKGKLAYMSPEQLVGGGVDRRSDVFALGTVLYETTTGRRPFRGENDTELMSAIVVGTFDPPSAIAPGYPRELERIVMRAMATDPDARYATARQLREALEGFLASSGPALEAQHISFLVRERCGHQGANRADLAARIESGSSAMEIARRPATSTERERGLGVIGGALAVLLGLTLGVGVLFYVREARRAHLASSSQLRRKAVAAPLVDAGAPPLASGVVSAAAIDATPAAPPTAAGGGGERGEHDKSEVHLLVPEGARLFLDGHPLPVGTTSVHRPDAGAHNVLVRAEGREDMVVVVEPDAPDEIQVTMPARQKRPPAHPPTGPAPSPTPTPSMPPNPYE
jgi:serine/threonine-protein kinase